MTKIEKLISNYPDYKKIIQAVVDGLSDPEEELHEISHHGADAGYGNFIYYDDTVAFANKHRSIIIKMLEEDSESMGIEFVEMIKGFGYFRSRKIDPDDLRDIYRFISGSKCKETTIPNLMCWYAVEKVAFWFDGLDN